MPIKSNSLLPDLHDGTAPSAADLAEALAQLGSALRGTETDDMLWQSQGVDGGALQYNMLEDVSDDLSGMLAALASGTLTTVTTTAHSTAPVMTSYSSGRAANLFNIDILFSGTGWTADLQKAYVTAVQRIESVIQGDLPDVMVRNAAGQLVKVDDIAITAVLKPIDGVGGILGQAGPTALRSAGYLPATATMQFDTADANWLNTKGLWDATVLHEMLHSIGFGTVWSLDKLTSGSGFVGKSAEAQYQLLTHGALAPVPLETTGGAGTAGAHWSEAHFHTELMTGWIDSVDPLSAMTAASLADIGYKLAAQSGWKVDAFHL